MSRLLSIVEYVSRYCFLKIRYNRRLITKGILRAKWNTEIRIDPESSILFGKKLHFFSNVHISAVASGKIAINDKCFFNRNCLVMCRDNIKIGNSCSFGPNVTIYDHDHKFGYDGIVKGEYKTGPVEIEDGCWIGANVTILRNTHIGHHSVIGAGCIVKGDIPPHSLVTSDRQLKIVPIATR